MLLFTYWLYCLTINQLEMVSANKYNHCNYSFYYTKRPDQGVDEVAGASVIADLLDCAIEHGIDNGVVGGEVDAVVHRALAGEWVGTVTEG